jgi:predicted phosphodiesterase
MRIATLYDIHGNLPALEAVLAELAGERITAVVIGGDVLPGPLPCESLDALRAMPWPALGIHGNGESAVKAVLGGGPLPTIPPSALEAVTWCAQALRPADRAIIEHWPANVRLLHPSLGRLLFCHATPRNDTEIFTAATPEAVLRPVFDAAMADVVICGHTHTPFDRQVGRTRVVNAGSVGMPFGPPGASWLLLGETIEFRHTPYDLHAGAARIRASDYPQREQFAERSVLHPPEAAGMQEMLERNALRA